MHTSIIRKRSRTPDIPTASTADVAFLLILFFMVTTVFRATSIYLKINLPEAESTERILMRRNVAHIWVDNTGKIYIDDNIVTLELLATKVAQKAIDNPEIISTLNIDETVNYGLVDGILDQLKEAQAFRITFATEFAK